jgi:late competence protein required for DNA uptake (superfamily II DNA/RNA helicase)
MKEKPMKIRCASCLKFKTKSCKKAVKWDDKACENHQKNHWLGRLTP